MIFRPFDVVVSIGFFNSCIFAIVLLAKINRTATNKLLAYVLLILGLLSAKILVHTLGFWQTPIFRYFPLGIDLWLPPLLWFYVLALTEPKKLTQSLFQKHLLIPLLFLLYALLVYFCIIFIENLDEKTHVANRLLYNEIKMIEDILSVVWGIYYGILSYNQLKRYQKWVESYISNTAVPTYKWLRNLLIISAVVLLLLGIMIVSQQFHILSFVPIQLFYFYLVFLVYVFGFFGFRHQDFKISIDLISKKSEMSSNTNLMVLLENLQHWMQSDKPYLEPDLNLNQCAVKLNCSAQTLSEAINLGKNTNFRDYINQLRITEFKNRIAKTNLQKETIMGVAYECGFNSEASFYRIFKEKTGITPKAFIQNEI